MTVYSLPRYSLIGKIHTTKPGGTAVFCIHSETFAAEARKTAGRVRMMSSELANLQVGKIKTSR